MPSCMVAFSSACFQVQGDVCNMNLAPGDLHAVFEARMYAIAVLPSLLPAAIAAWQAAAPGRACLITEAKLSVAVWTGTVSFEPNEGCRFWYALFKVRT